MNLGPLPYQGCFSDQRHVLQPRSAGLPVCPRVTVMAPGGPSDRARGGHDPQIRSFGQVVQDRPSVSALWVDVPDLPTPDKRRLAAWQQCWQQPPASRSLPLLSPPPSTLHGQPTCTLQGMARVRSGQARAWPLVSGRRECRGSDAQGRVLKIISVKRLEMIFGCP